MVVSFGSILLGAIAAGTDQDVAAGPAFALGFGLVPIVFVIIAFGSKAESAPVSIVKAMLLWVVIALPIGLLNPITGLTAAFGAGAAVTFRKSDYHRRWIRAAAVAISTIYVTALVFIFTQAGIFAGAVTPLLAIKAADLYMERRARMSGDEDG
jgi:hypothetical protein